MSNTYNGQADAAEQRAFVERDAAQAEVAKLREEIATLRSQVEKLRAEICEVADYRDGDGRFVTLDLLCQQDPAWAASRIRAMTKAIRAVLDETKP